MSQNSRDPKLSYGENPKSLSKLVLERYRDLTDRQTLRHQDTCYSNGNRTYGAARPHLQVTTRNSCWLSHASIKKITETLKSLKMCNLSDTNRTYFKTVLCRRSEMSHQQPGLPWIWISMDISMDIMLAHLLIKLNTYMLYVSISLIFSCLSFLLCIFRFCPLFTLLSQMNNQWHQHAIILFCWTRYCNV